MKVINSPSNGQSLFFDSTDKETIILGSIIYSPNRFYPIAYHLGISAEHFNSSPHKEAWIFLSDKHREGESIDPTYLFANYSSKLESFTSTATLIEWRGKACSDEHSFRTTASLLIESHNRREIAKRILDVQATLQGGDMGDCHTFLEEAMKIAEGSMSNTSTCLLSKVYEMKYDPDNPPPLEESCMFLGDDYPVAARGNITVIQGKAKVGKSAIISAILGAAIRGTDQAKGDAFQFSWRDGSMGAIIHLDTEQSPSDWHSLVGRSIKRSGISEAEADQRFTSIPTVTFSRKERMKVLEGLLEKESEKHAKVNAVIIDGIADLMTAPNDEAESLELVSKILSLSHQYDCAIFVVLHENPSSESGKTRGHLGSELNRKAFANLRIDKDIESDVSVIYGTDMRKRDIPKHQGFCFGWCDREKMHVYKGRHAGIKAAKAEEKRIHKAREQLEPIFDQAKDLGTFGIVPALTPKQAVEIERDISGTEKPTSESAMKKRLQRAEKLGVTKNTGNSQWKYIYEGTTGTN